MKKVFKYITIIPLYIVCVLEGVVGGTAKKKDMWEDLVKWARK